MNNVRRLPTLEVTIGSKRRSINASLGDILIGTNQYPFYNGTYEVVPDFVDQRLETAHMVMSNDVLVKEIPVYTVSNLSGGQTVIIGEDDNYGS